MEHVHLEDHLAALLNERPFPTIYAQIHLHLFEVCSDCRDRWSGRSDYRSADPAAAEVPPMPSEPDAAPRADLERCVSLLQLSREAARKGREDLQRLLRLPSSNWLVRVRRARTRLRSRAFAECMIEESSRRVRRSPKEATLLAQLVRPALDREPGRIQKRWAQILLARAQAHHANAIRVEGDLKSAARIFVALRAEYPMITGTLAEAEIARLEASLRIDQRDFSEADRLLTAAGRAYRQSADERSLARVLLEQAYLLQIKGEPTGMPPLISEALPLLTPTDEPYLYSCAVHGLISAMLDLGEVSEAEAFLEAERPRFLDVQDRHLEATIVGLEARIDLAKGRATDAIGGFTASRDLFLELERSFDAILVSLYLADALLAAGRLADLRDLTRELVPMFEARGVAREALVALRLLVEAVRRETVTASLIEEVRRKLRGEG